MGGGSGLVGLCPLVTACQQAASDTARLWETLQVATPPHPTPKSLPPCDPPSPPSQSLPPAATGWGCGRYFSAR